MEVARGVSIPLQLDQFTRDQAYGFYARVLVNIDLTSNQPSFLNVERDDYRGFSVDVIYENLLERCTKCKAFGHESTKCYQNKREIKSDRGRSRSRYPRQTYHPITKNNTTGVTIGIEDKIQDQRCEATNSDFSGYHKRQFVVEE
ncbi:hypothetical protein Dsin_012114 [Dipteronia sinensis]|uniref:Zinc knuckle CX2CX4HX4C domain-containing protein n=1 Tax=Dipteronia sinensis TaxID=43782 RepID=A0AAE0AIQ0_9ROSI|nr:hypothetical protein Dsin_012114 [Dipteronia sinensis]